MFKPFLNFLASFFLQVPKRVFCLSQRLWIEAFLSFLLVNLAFLSYFLILASITNIFIFMIFPVCIIIFSYNFLVNFNKFFGFFSWIICFGIPKIFEVSAICFISSLSTILRCYDSLFFFEALKWNFLIFLVILFMLSFFLFFSNERIKKFFLKSLCIFLVISIYINFFVSTAFAVDELSLLVKDDYQISDKKKQECKIAAELAVLAIEDLKNNDQKSFNLKSQAISSSFGSNITTQGVKGFESKFFLHIKEFLEKGNIFVGFSYDINHQEGIPIFSSAEDLFWYRSRYKDPVVLLFKNIDGDWIVRNYFTKNNGLFVEQKLSKEFDDFLSSRALPEFSNIFKLNIKTLDCGVSFNYYVISIGDLFLQEKSFNDILVFECKTTNKWPNSDKDLVYFDNDLKKYHHLEKQILIFNEQNFYRKASFSKIPFSKSDFFSSGFSNEKKSELTFNRLFEVACKRSENINLYQKIPMLKIDHTASILNSFLKNFK